MNEPAYEYLVSVVTVSRGNSQQISHAKTCSAWFPSTLANSVNGYEMR